MDDMLTTDDFALTDPQNCLINNELPLLDVALNLSCENRHRPSETLKQLAYSALQWVQISASYYPTMGRWYQSNTELEELKSAYEKTNVDFLETRFDLSLVDHVQELLFKLSIDAQQVTEQELDLLGAAITVYRDYFEAWLKRKQAPLSKFWFDQIRSNANQEQSEDLGAKIKQSKATSHFSKFKNLRFRDISLIMDSDKATFVINRKRIVVLPQDLGLKGSSQGWKLLESAAFYSGNFTDALKILNKTNDREAEKIKVKTAISRLRKHLTDSMGLCGDPIVFNKGGYKLAFKVVTHADLGGRVTKGADAMEHLGSRTFEESEYGGDSEGFFGDNFNPADY
jgi:hypothetical protein